VQPPSDCQCIGVSGRFCSRQLAAEHMPQQKGTAAHLDEMATPVRCLCTPDGAGQHISVCLPAGNCWPKGWQSFCPKGPGTDCEGAPHMQPAPCGPCSLFPVQQSTCGLVRSLSALEPACRVFGGGHTVLCLHILVTRAACGLTPLLVSAHKSTVCAQPIAPWMHLLTHRCALLLPLCRCRCCCASLDAIGAVTRSQLPER
jgi:hypothetical protein